MMQSMAQKTFIKKERNHRISVVVMRIVILIGFIVLWQVCAMLGILNDFIFSSPVKIGKYLFESCKDGSLFYHTGVTLAETVVSFFFVTVVGLLLSILLWSSRRMSEILEPYFVVLNSLPKSALAPVLIVWLGNNKKTVVVTGILIAVFSAAITMTTSLKQTDSEKIKLIQSMGGNRLDVLCKVAIPSSIPVFLATMKVNIGLCLVGVIIGEFLAADSGLGYLIIYGSQTFKMTMVMASIVVLCILSAILYQLIAIIEKRVDKME
jgi:NitT/TauT family transport system permease protein